MNDNERFRQTFVRETDAMIEHYKLKVSTSAEDAQQELLKTKTYVLSRASEFIEECTYKTLAKPKMAPQLQKYMRTQFHSRFADKVITPYNEEMQHLFIDLPESVERCAQDLGQKWKATGLIPLPRMKEIKHKVWAEEVNILRKKMLQLIELGDAIGLATSSLIFGMVGYKIGEEYAEFKGKESAASVMQSGMDVIQTGLELTSSLILEGSAFTAGGGVVGAGGGIAVTAGAAPVMLAEAGLIAAAGVDGAAKGSLAGPIGASIGIAAGGDYWSSANPPKAQELKDLTLQSPIE